ncbi:hypothetical protein BHAOGJBA_0287 [Methylobacterium hispanicum]|jgi:hypothetical protein|uniref:Uncharacterized protein n=1 Tax=Methylobacterium hispanicum TaxID=270350 RepID=A0AAV4ZFA9_9HYPH|nr:hypothetical protein BHAOGJBA_0287 [Methylobacterium hispanicum]
MVKADLSGPVDPFRADPILSGSAAAQAASGAAPQSWRAWSIVIGSPKA